MRTHCDDPSLLAYLDHELSFWNWAIVKWHLGHCAECRAELNNLGYSTKAVAQSLEEKKFSTKQIEAAKRRFFAEAENRNINFREPGERHRSLRIFRLSAEHAALGAGFLTCASALAVWMAVQPVKSVPQLAPGIQTRGSPAPRTGPVVMKATPEIAAIVLPRATVKREPQTANAETLDQDALEVSLLFALHRSGSCLGEQIELIRRESSGFVIRGIMSSSERRQALLDRLAELEMPGVISIEIHTIDEVAQASPLPEVIAPSEHPLPETETSRMRRHELQVFFEDKFRDEKGADLQQRISDFSNAAVTKAHRAFADAWAIRRLSDRFSSSRIRSLNSESEVQLTSMIQDHLRSLQSQISVLAGLVGLDGDDTAGDLSELDSMETRDWNILADRAFHSTKDVHESIISLFASGDVPGETSAEHVPELKRELKVLLTTLLRCSRQVNALIIR